MQPVADTDSTAYAAVQPAWEQTSANRYLITQ